MNFPGKVKLVEVGPRDGLQNEKQFLDTEKKISLIKQLVRAGFTEIEATSFVHPKWIPNLADAEQVIEQIKALPVTFFALVPNERGYERALTSEVQGVTFVLSATDSHNQRNLNKTTEESSNELIQLLQRAQADGVRTRASVSTVFGCPFEQIPSIERILMVIDRLVKGGFTRIGLCDTIGIANPQQVYDYMVRIVREFSQIEFELHFHNTYGRGLPNVLAALEAGIYSFDSSIGGLGGCPYAPGATGNISTEDLVDMLHASGIETGINILELLKASDMVHDYFGKALDSSVWRVKYSQRTVLQ